jgi:PAS domain S-box-containing protein
MKSNHSSNWSESPQEKAELRQPQLNNSTREHWKPKAVQSLQEKRSEFESLLTLFDNLPCIGFILNSAGVILSVTQFGADYLGYDAFELSQKLVSKVFHPEDRASYQENLTNLQQKTQISQWSARLVHKDGNVVWVRARLRLVPQTQSNPIILLVCEEITTPKQKQEVLGESEARFQHIIDSNAIGFFFFDYNGIITEANNAFLQLIGYTREELLAGKLCWDALTPTEYQPLDQQAIQEIIVSGVSTPYEKEFIRKDGSRVPMMVTAARSEEKQGTGQGFAFVRDLTKRKIAEEALQQQLMKERLVGTTLGRIHQSLNLEEILNTTVAEVQQFLACDRVIIFRIHPDGSGVVVVESVGSEWRSMSGTLINDRHFAEVYIRLYQQGRVHAVEDIYAAGLTKCHVDLLAQFQARANLVVPIVHKEQLWGLLVAQQCGETRKWQPLEIDLLKSLATQTAIAIQRSELYQQAQIEISQRQQAEDALRKQFQRERLVAAITQRIRKSLDLDTILNATVAEVRQALQTDRVIIFRFEPDWSGNVVVESVGSSWSAILGTNIYDPCFEQEYILPYQQGRVKSIEDIHTGNLSQCHFDLLAQFQVRANLVVPILNKERLWGLLVAHHCSDGRQWQQFEIDLLTSLASQVAIAIQQSQLYEQAKAQAKREQALNQVTQAIRQSLDLETIFSTATHEIEKLLQVDCAQIVQYLPERKLWVSVAACCKGLGLAGGIGLEIPDENNEIANRLKRLEVVRIDDTDSFEGKINRGVDQNFPRAWLLVPLQFNSSVWGALGLMMDVGPYHWQDSEVELICEVADQLAIALQQAELYNQSCLATATAQTQAHQLEKALQELQRTQAQLVQSEKMSSLGQLVAGVAHEINNPVSFIYGNLVHAGGYTQDLLGLIQLYQKQYPIPTPEINSEIEALDLDFLIEDLPKLLDSMKIGAERICEIVSSLRNFSRIAEAERKAVDIHEGLDSTLVILRNRLKAQGDNPGIQVIKEYGNLPKVECYAGQLNQVFMNLFTNAIDAIDEQTDSLEQIPATPSTIRVRTELLNDHQVAIRIVDNGPGMTEQVKARLFDPFFTTKPVGTGTGLGLSISYQIVVERHGGQLLCFSELGQGTEFVIQIPISQCAKD